MAGSRLNLTQVATLHEFVRRGTLAAAADALGYTAGAASQHISGIEAVLGVPIMKRVGRQLVLTDAGRVMAEYADELLRLELSALQAARAAAGAMAGPLTVGTWGSTGAGILAPVAEQMARTYPNIAIASREVDLDGAADAVRHGDVDVAFGLDYEDAPMRRDPLLHVTEVRQENFWVTVASSYPKAEFSTIGVDELAELDWILPPETNQFGRAIRDGFRRRGVEPKVVHELTETAASLQLAAAGFGATVMTDLMRRINPSLRLKRLTMANPLTRRVILISHGETPTLSVNAFIEQSHEVVASLLASY